MIHQEMLRLERMSSAEKVKHWLQEKPWRLNGKSLRLPRIKAFSPAQVAVDDNGRITMMPLLIWRPCFGQVTAFLRHGGSRYVYSPRQKSWHPTRCSRCEVKDACAFVAEERLRSTQKLADVHREWRNLGGRDQTWLPNGSRGPAALRLPDILRELQGMVFTSGRDREVQEHYEQAIEAKLVKDRERKQRDRERQTIAKARVGEITPAVEQVLDGELMWRAVEHKKACGHPDAPKSLRHALPDTSMFDAHVWAAHTRVWLRGVTPNPHSCATELHQMGLERQRSVNALRDRVRRSIDRMHLLQRLHLGGRQDPVWPQFTLADLKEGLRHQPPTD